MKFIKVFALLVLTTASLAAAEIKVATLNAFLFFDPSIDHPGKVDDENRLAPEDYRRKTANLSKLIDGYEVVGLQETGGRSEIEALAKTAGLEWAYAKGRDTFTGQEVGLLHRLPGWKIVNKGRVGALDRVVSKHLYVTATKDRETVHFLVVHLIRPIGKNVEKNGAQRDAIGAWVAEILRLNPEHSVVVLGDFNIADKGSETSLIGVGKEIGLLNGFAGTHLARKPFDRMILAGRGHWISAEIRQPPYGNKPNDLNKRLWSDHFLLGGVMSTDPARY